LLQEEQTQAHNATRALLEALWHKLVPILLPDGAASLYLPKGGSLLLPHIDQHLQNPTFLYSHGEQAEKFLRELKVALLYWALTSLRQQLDAKTCLIPSYDLSSNIISSIEPLLSLFHAAFITFELPKENAPSPNAVALAIARTLFYMVQSTSLESILMKTWLTATQSSEKMLRSENELEECIDAFSHDDRLIKTFLHLTTPSIDMSTPQAKDLTGAFWGMLVHGLTSSMRDVLIEDALGSLDWELAQRTVLDRLHWFFFSPYADEAMATWLGAAKA
jgi:hypothetical protein